jgi:hypothetical protein
MSCKARLWLSWIELASGRSATINCRSQGLGAWAFWIAGIYQSEYFVPSSAMAVEVE